MRKTDCIALKHKNLNAYVVTKGLTEFKHIMGVIQYCNLLKKRFGDNFSVGGLCKVTELFLESFNKDYFCDLDYFCIDTYKYVVVIDDDAIAFYENNKIVGVCYLCAGENVLCAIDDVQEDWYRLGHEYIQEEVAKQKFKSDLLS